MKISAKQFFEVAGVTGVIASLVFVGMQLRLDRTVAMAGQYSARAESVKADFRTRLESENYVAARAVQWKGGQRPEGWSDDSEERFQSSGLSFEQQIAIYLNGELSLIQFDNLYFQYTQGMLSEEFWEGGRESLKNALRSPSTRSLWNSHNPRLPIMGIFDALVEEIESE